MSSDVASRIDAIRTEIDHIAREAGRDPQEVRLVAVSKTVGVPEIEAAVAAGQHLFGENRIDSLAPKVEAVEGAQWHFIGNIQSRRIPEIVAASDLIHSLCKFEHAEKISRAAQAAGKVQDVLVQVNVSGEESKSGIEPEEAPEFVRELTKLPNVRFRGLMTMAPRGLSDEDLATFADLAKLAAELEGALGPFEGGPLELSMGMSEDWRLAVTEGATLVRIGRAVFDPEF